MMKWFSSKIRLVVLIESKGGTRYADSVYLFKSIYDWDIAFQKALEIGKNQEQDYTNLDGQKVRVRLKEIISLDVIKELLVKGIEVYSEPVWFKDDEIIDFNTKFQPEKSEPTQTF